MQTAMQTTAAASSHLFQVVGEVLASAQLEIAVLVLAACAHVLIFGKRRVAASAGSDPKKGGTPTAGKRPTAGRARAKGVAACAGAGGRGLESEAGEPEPPRAALEAALQALDLQAALRSLSGFPNGSVPQGLQGQLQRLVRLAVAQAAVPDLLRERSKCGSALSTCLCNTLLDACIENEDRPMVERVMADALANGVADVVTFNTLLKARLREGDLKGAKKAIQAMRAAGLQPNCVTFNELLDATISTDLEAAWALVSEMKASGLKPNRITCSILLKGVQHGSRAVDADRALAIVEDMDNDMDEVLLSSTLEACIRVNRNDLLVRQLRRHCDDRRVQVKGAQTFGSIIRAYGCVGDIEGVKRTWREVRARRVPLTSITLGCLVEALAANGDPESAHALIKEVLADPQTRSVVNAVTYCSVVKGFSHRKQFDRVWALYQEMLEVGLQPQFSSVTYNTLVDACSRCGEVSRTPALLAEMVKQGIEPNLVTYSAVLKGYCQENRLDKAFELVEIMKQSPHVRPDEQTYNTLLDGCARQSLYKQGMEVFEDMRKAGVRPSNFTLSILVKLANRGRQLEVAFELCEELPRKYRFSLNIHVYNNLVQACIAHKELPRALDVLERMIREKVRPDSRTYGLLLRSCINASDAQAAAGLVRMATGLKGGLARFERFGTAMQPQGGLPSDLLSEVLEGIARHCRAKDLALELHMDLRQFRSFRPDPKLSMCLAKKAISAPVAP